MIAHNLSKDTKKVKLDFFKKLLTPTQRNSLRYVYREGEMTMMTVNEVSKLTGVSTDAIQRVLSQESVDIRNLFL